MSNYALDYLGAELYDGDRIIFIGEDARFHMGTIFLSDEEDSILTSSNSYLLLDEFTSVKGTKKYQYIIKL